MKDKINKNEIKEIYYTFKNYANNEDLIVVCLIVAKVNNVIVRVSRGLSICSKRDIFNIDKGKLLAKRNALRAKKNRNIECIKREEAILQLLKTDCPFIKKGYSDCINDLTLRECNIIYSKKKVIEYLKQIAAKKKEEFKQFIDTNFDIYSIWPKPCLYKQGLRKDTL